MVKIKLIKFATILTVFTLAIQARPSWCRNAHTSVEKRICNSRELIDLDYELSNVYNRLADIYRRYDYPSYRWLVRSEKRWIRERNTDCYDMSNRCIRRKYNQRIDYLYRLLKDY